MSRETKFKLKDKMDDHLTENDVFLMAIMDMAEAGRRDAEERGEVATNGRFIAIMELLTMYRERNTTFINSLYKPKNPPGDGTISSATGPRQDSRNEKAA